MKKITWKQHLCFVLLALIITISFYGFSTAVVCSDLPFHYKRIQGITDHIRMGTIKQWIYYGEYAYSYLVPVYYPDALLLPFCFLTIFDISDVMILQIILFSIHLLTMYFARNYWYNKTKNHKDSFLFAILYVLSLSSVIQIVYCALGRMFVYMAIPLLLDGVNAVLQNKRNQWHKIAIATGIIANANTVMFAIISIYLIIKCLRNHKIITANKKIKKDVIYSIITSIGLSLVTILPFIEAILSDKNHVFLQSGIITKQIVTIESSIAVMLPESIGTPIVNAIIAVSELKNQIIATCVFTIIILLYAKFSKNEKKAAMITGLSLLFASTCMFPWTGLCKILPVLQVIEISFRLSILFDIYFLEWVVHNRKEWQPLITSILVTLIIFLCTKPILDGMTPLDKENINNTNEITSEYGFAYEYIPENHMHYLLAKTDKERFVDAKIELYAMLNNLDSGEGVIEESDTATITRTGSAKFDVEYHTENTVEIPLFFYNGYVIRDENGIRYDYWESDRGFIELKPNNKDGLLYVIHQWTLCQLFGFVVSFVTLLFVVISFLTSHYEKRILNACKIRTK